MGGDRIQVQSVDDALPDSCSNSLNQKLNEIKFKLKMKPEGLHFNQTVIIK